MSYLEIETDKIDPNPFYKREIAQERIDELAGSLTVCGQLSPIRVRKKADCDGRYELVFGHQRLMAARSLNWKSLKAEMVPTSDQDMIVHALVENSSREGFADFERAKLMQKLKQKYGWSNSRLASCLGKSTSYVTQHLIMLNLLGNDLNKIEADEENRKIMNSLSEHHARILARLPNFKDRKEAARLTVLARLGVRETERLVSRSVMNGHKVSVQRISQRKKVELNEIVAKLVSAYESRSFMEIAKLRHESKFNLFDDIPPFERLNYGNAISHVAGIMDGMKDIRVLIDGLQISTFRNFAILTFYLRFDSIWDEKPFRIISRVTLVLLHESRQWKIVHEHWSPMSLHYLKFLNSISEDSVFENLPLSPKHSYKP